MNNMTQLVLSEDAASFVRDFIEKRYLEITDDYLEEYRRKALSAFMNELVEALVKKFPSGLATESARESLCEFIYDALFFGLSSRRNLPREYGRVAFLEDFGKPAL